MTGQEEEGYIVECDLEYPDGLHYDHASFPLAPESVKITSSILSPFATGKYFLLREKVKLLKVFFLSDCHEILNPTKKNYSATKLTATFQKRKKYVTHYANLALYIRLGLKLTRVRRVLSFRQTNFLKIYIDHCTMLRKKSKTDFGKTLWKLFANAVFGKFIESSRDYLDIKVCLDKNRCKKLITNPNFSNLKIISEEIVLVFSKKPYALLNKPYAVGFTILEKAKHFMYQQYYDVIKPNLGNCEVLMSDTDSFLIAIHTDAETDNLDKIKHIIDFSNYPKDNIKYNTKNENKLGFFKDEMKGSKITEYSGVRAKAYVIEVLNELTRIKHEQIKLKGITAAARKKMGKKHFIGCVKSIKKFRVTQHHIRSKNHLLQTIAVNKIALTSFDDKRFLFNCSVHSVPYGSKIIRENKLMKCPFCKMFNPLQK
jgi:hypothetical protein